MTTTALATGGLFILCWAEKQELGTTGLYIQYALFANPACSTKLSGELGDRPFSGSDADKNST